ncbi:hypothetical protein NCWK1_0182 [Nostoc cycadae WK-1]|uniref:Uncharacterized protein n=1 Tax=Nostoc cycadae WK-1 TaxID=1861711 RepID=A0A2H6LBE9_9NOSO|nr:hypothetical protein NCWK1_0182 [Nostoc cycadae WK-1]
MINNLFNTLNKLVISVEEIFKLAFTEKTCRDYKTIISGFSIITLILIKNLIFVPKNSKYY